AVCVPSQRQRPGGSGVSSMGSALPERSAWRPSGTIGPENVTLSSGAAQASPTGLRCSTVRAAGAADALGGAGAAVRFGRKLTALPVGGGGGATELTGTNDDGAGAGGRSGSLASTRAASASESGVTGDAEGSVPRAISLSRTPSGCPRDPVATALSATFGFDALDRGASASAGAL